MAPDNTTVYTNLIATAGSGGSKILRGYLDWDDGNSTKTAYRMDWTAGVNAYGGSSSAIVNYQITCTNRDYDYSGKDNGAYKAKGSYTPLYTNYYSFTKGTTASTQTITFKIWTSHGSASTTKTFKVPALDRYTLTYKVNGGDGTDWTDNTFYHGKSKAISTTKPTKAGYTFKGWANTSSGSKVYDPGDPISLTADKDIFAVWQPAYVLPKVQSVMAYRVSDGASGKSPQQDNEGTRAYIEFTTDKGTNINSNEYLTNYEVKINNAVTSLTNSLLVDTSDSSINTYYGYIGDVGDLSKDLTYNISIEVMVTTIQNIKPTFSTGTFISAEVYIIDVSADGKRISFGQKAEDAPQGTTRNDFAVEVNGDIYLKYGDNSNKVADYVIEIGNVGTAPTGIWEYKKYASGRFEAWLHSYTVNNVAVATSLAGYGGFRSAAAWHIAVPNLGTTNVQYGHVEIYDGTSSSGGHAGLFATVTYIDGRSIYYWVHSSVSLAAGTNFYIRGYATGTWS